MSGRVVRTRALVTAIAAAAVLAAVLSVFAMGGLDVLLFGSEPATLPPTAEARPWRNDIAPPSLKTPTHQPGTEAWARDVERRLQQLEAEVSRLRGHRHWDGGDFAKSSTPQ